MPWALLFALFLVLLAVTPVSAVPPDRGDEIYEAYVDPDVVDCTVFGFDYKIQDWIEITTQSTIFYDKDGTPELRMKGQGVDNLYNPNNPDYRISGSFSWNFRGDPDTFEGITTGAFWHIVLPGYGPVFFHAGRAEFNLQDWYVPLHGHHELDQKLCEILDYTVAQAATAANTSTDNFLYLPSVIR